MHNGALGGEGAEAMSGVEGGEVWGGKYGGEGAGIGNGLEVVGKGGDDFGADATALVGGMDHDVSEVEMEAAVTDDSAAGDDLVIDLGADGEEGIVQSDLDGAGVARSPADGGDEDLILIRRRRALDDHERIGH